ncbi:uncharacterized protein LOC122327522 [Puntigrus tetrazona]|uniref:uncharacterized protein LOC122327522 n=1 Tax=Puntigrus tetrazona TaxID=1606681 RepID=UPI001C8A22B3|nr:uncharacterized protein LOC122327522 [Puntigrus tetrazona]
MILGTLVFFSVLNGGLAIETHGVSVIEGDSVTLNTDVKVQKEDHILWTFGPQSAQIAEIIQMECFVFVLDDWIFKEKLHMDNQTGSLTIRNIRSEHAGLYQLQITRPSSKVSLKRFNVTVYVPLPIPVISRDDSRCSSSSSGCSSGPKCLLLCSVVNVGHGTLSWYKGNRLLFVSDLSTSLSVPLEVECLDDSYSCVVAYSFTNRSKRLTELCLTCSELRRHEFWILLITLGFLLLALLIVPVCRCLECY